MTETLARQASKLRRPGLALVAMALLAGAAPSHAQGTGDAEARLRKIEAEMRALQRQVFPGSDGKFFTPEVTGQAAPSVNPGAPASTPVSDLLTRMEAVEAQLSRLTAHNEETANRVAQLEAKVVALTPAPASVPATLADPAAPAGTAASAQAAAVPVTTLAAAPVPAATTAAAALARPAARPAPVKPVAAAPVSAKPSAQRLAAVQKIVKPATGNAADDEYTYGFRLWEAKFYPEAQQQLQLYVDKYPRDRQISFGRNLLGRAFLEDGKPREAGAWFVKNYQADKNGARAADSLLGLAEAMRQLKDTSRACIAMAEFGEVYPREATGRLKAQYTALRGEVKCD